MIQRRTGGPVLAVSHFGHSGVNCRYSRRPECYLPLPIMHGNMPIHEKGLRRTLADMADAIGSLHAEIECLRSVIAEDPQLQERYSEALRRQTAPPDSALLDLLHWRIQAIFDQKPLPDSPETETARAD